MTQLRSENRAPTPRGAWQGFASGLPRRSDFGLFLRWTAATVALGALLLGTGNAPAAQTAGQPAAAPPPALTNLADNLPLEELGRIPIATVSAASGFTQSENQAPASVSVITAEEFKQYGYRTLADALRSVPGLYVSSDRTYSYLGLRGFNRPGDYNSRVLVLVDGHRLNDNVFEGVYIGEDFIVDADLIDRVEVVRGPSSSLYGSSAFFGVINVVTRRAADVQHAEVSAEAGSAETYKGRFSSGGVFTNAGVSLLLSGSFYHSEGQAHLYYPEFDSPTNHYGLADHLDQEQVYNLFGSLAWRDLTLSAAYVSREKHIPTASWGTVFNDPRYEAIDERGYIDLKLRHEFNEETELTARTYFDDVRYTADYPISPLVSPQDVGLNHDRALGQMVGVEAQLIHRWRSHTLSVGTELRDHLHQDLANYDVAPRTDYADEHQSGFDAGVYVQDEFAIRTNLLLNAGVRYDHYESFGGTLNPRLGLIYNPWSSGTFKLLYGTAYRAPNAYELYFPLGELPPDPHLDPERIQTYELVYEQFLAANLRLRLSAYYYHIDDLISIDPETLLFENRGQVSAPGLETELEWRLACGLRARASYSIQRAEWTDTEAALANSPEHLAKLNLLVPLLKDKLFTGLEVQYSSRAATLPDRSTPFADAFTVVNLTLFSQKLIKGVEVSASVYNLFDTRYAYPGGPGHQQDLIYQDGRGFRFKLTYKF
jgi:outer membrane receptor for ferrienterochelin and colicins